VNKFFALIKGEVIRLWRYQITLFGLIVSAIWIILLAVVSKEEANALLPQLIVLDSGLMAIILLGAAYFYEKQEGTMKAVLVSPTSPAVLLSAKIIGTLMGNLLSVFLMWLTMLVVHQSVFPIFAALGLVIIITLTHLSIGYVLIYWSKDFMDLLLKYTFIVLVLFVPTILVSLEILTDGLENLAYISPTYSGQILISQLWNTETESILVAWILTIVYPLGLFPFYILPQFRKEAIRA
jgi:fluoroquinolone transport system permease protein